MKQIFCVILSVIMMLSFASCFESDKPTKQQAQAPVSSKKAEEKYGLNETAVFSALKFTATEIKQSNGTNFFTPEAENVFVGVKFTVENISDEEQAISTLLLFEGYADDVKCDYSFSAACAFDEGTLDGSVAPGKKLVGWYALEVPKDWSEIELDVQATWLSNNPAKFVFTK